MTHHPEWLEDSLDDVMALREPREHWDSNSEGTPKPKAVATAVSLLLAVAEVGETRPAIVPTDIGGIQIEWNVHGWNVKLEVPPEADACEALVEREARE